MTRLYTLAEAQAMLPLARGRVAEAVACVSELQQLVARMEAGPRRDEDADRRTALEEAVEDVFSWFEANGVQVKSLAPALLDFPARAIREGEPVEVFLCWRDDEPTIAYYHPPEGGYRSREPVGLLDRV